MLKSKDDSGTLENVFYWLTRLMRCYLFVYTILFLSNMLSEQITLRSYFNQLITYDYRNAFDTKQISKEILFCYAPIIYILFIGIEEGIERFLQILRRVVLFLFVLLYLPSTSPTITLILHGIQHVNKILIFVYMVLVIVSSIYYYLIRCSSESTHETIFLFLMIKTVLQDCFSPLTFLRMTVRRIINFFKVIIELIQIRFSSRYRENAFNYFISNYGWYTCSKCGSKFRKKDMDVDHIHPQARGGSNSLFNVQLLCRSCNRSKGKSIRNTPKDKFNQTTKVFKSIKDAIRNN